MVCAACHKSHTHVLHSQAYPSVFSFSHPLSPYMLDGATEFYGSCVLWQCERHRKERPCFLWCSCCCGPEEIRTHMHTHMDAHPGMNKHSQRRFTLPALTPPPSATSPVVQLPRGLINSLLSPTSTFFSHILVCSHFQQFALPGPTQSVWIGIDRQLGK